MRHQRTDAPVPSRTWEVLATWTLASEPGNERIATSQVVDLIAPLAISARRLERLKTAVAEATMNAMEHGNHYRVDLPVAIQVLQSPESIAIRITDQGGREPIPDTVEPDLEAKLQGLQSPRGWGLFLIKNLVDEMHVTTDQVHHTIELIMHLEGEQHTDEAS